MLEGGDAFVAFSFAVFGIIGILVTLVVIRANLHPVRLKAGSILSGIVLLGIGCVAFGYTTGRIVEALILLTALISVTALLDFLGYFRLRKKTR